MSGEFSTGKTIFVLAIVVGCFAVLWPKVFYPMLTASIKSTTEGVRQDGMGPRPERPSHLHPDMMHPALREKGRALPQRTIEKQARPGPMPGVRPPMGGGAGHIAPPHQAKGASSMSIIMPLYTVGIIIFFIYTIMKVLFKKTPDDDEKAPKLKDFHLDPEYRKYVFAEEYLDSGSDAGLPSSNDHYRRMEKQEGAGLRRRPQPDHSEPKIQDEQMDQLRKRLEDTEKAMERLMSQMGSVSDKLTAAKITEVLSQAQAQAKLLKTEGKSVASSKGSSPDMDEYEVVQKTVENVASPDQDPSSLENPSAGTEDTGDASAQLSQTVEEKEPESTNEMKSGESSASKEPPAEVSEEKPKDIDKTSTENLDEKVSEDTETSTQSEEQQQEQEEHPSQKTPSQQE